MKKPKLLFSKVREVKPPEYGTPGAAGIDFFVPEFTESFLKEVTTIPQNVEQIKLGRLWLPEGKIVLRGHGRVLIPSGIHVNLEAICEELDLPGYFEVGLLAKNKSGVGSKKGLHKLAELVDQDYQGEIHINISNSSEVEQSISPNEKLIQFVLTPIIKAGLVQIKHDKLYNSKTQRGINGFSKGSGK